MLSWIIQFTIISIILIFLVHHLFNFFKSTLTVPKIKDLVNSPTQKYENMYNIISSSSNSNGINNNSNNTEYTISDLLPQPDPTPTPTMKSELKNFLKKQLNTNHNSNNTSNNNSNNNTSTDITALDSMMGIQSYSSFK